MNLIERLHQQARDLTVCNEDLRHITDPAVRAFIKRLRRIRHEAMYQVGRDWSPSAWAHLDLPFRADWAAHRLAVAVGIDRPLDDSRNPEADYSKGINPKDVHLLLTYMRALSEGRLPPLNEETHDDRTDD